MSRGRVYPSPPDGARRGACCGKTGRTSLYFAPRARMAELVDAPDSKSGSGNRVWVRFPLRAPARHRKKPPCRTSQTICCRPGACATLKKTGLHDAAYARRLSRRSPCVSRGSRWLRSGHARSTARCPRRDCSDDHEPARQPGRQQRRAGLLQRRGAGFRSAGLPVEPQRHAHRRSRRPDLHHGGYRIRQRCSVLRRRQQSSRRRSRARAPS